MKNKSDVMLIVFLMALLLGQLEGTIRDLRLVDVSYGIKDLPPPNWVAASLIELKPKKYTEEVGFEPTIRD